MFVQVLASAVVVATFLFSSISPFSFHTKQSVAPAIDCESMMIRIEKLSIENRSEEIDAAKAEYRTSCGK